MRNRIERKRSRLEPNRYRGNVSELTRNEQTSIKPVAKRDLLVLATLPNESDAGDYATATNDPITEILRYHGTNSKKKKNADPRGVDESRTASIDRFFGEANR